MPRGRSRTSVADGQIIITGTGRAGTTYLVQLFSALGFDTGFSPAEAMTNVDEISNAGLEGSLFDNCHPYVIKSPWLADYLVDALENERIKIYAAIIPLRDLFAAAESRRRVYHEAQRRGIDPLAQPGSLWHTKNPAEQEDKLARQLYKAVYALIRFDIPTFFLEFPRLVEDPDYQFRKLARLMKDHEVSEAEFLIAHRKVARPHIIHKFK
jgi:hypothetical protein